MKDIQQYQWGSIQWLTDQKRSTNEILDVGLVTIHVDCMQDTHIHYGDEQYVYVLEGQAISSVNGEKEKLTAGDMLYIPAGSAHETRNISTEPLLELIISFPKELEQFWGQQTNTTNNIHKLLNISDTHWKISENEIELLENYASSLALPIVLYNNKGDCLYSNEAYPKVCRELCAIDASLENCHLYKENMHYSSPAYSEQTAYYCRYGLAVLDTPIIVGQHMIGRIRGGHLLVEDGFKKITPEVAALSKTLAKIPKSRLRTILTQYKRMAEQLSYNHLQTLTEVEKPSDKENDQLLKEDLDRALGSLLNLQINNHFLFNTLNAIAGLSIEEGAMKTYDAIINLSKLFRYSLRNAQEFVPLKEEIDYIKQYLNLQKIRFGDRLRVDFDIDESSLNCYVPYSTLQPLVENAFVHGFRDFTGVMTIRVQTTILNNRLVLEIIDNGLGIDRSVKKRLVKTLKEGIRPRRGLALVFDRLSLFFGQEIDFQIDNREMLDEQGTRVLLSLPKRVLQESLMGGPSEESINCR